MPLCDLEIKNRYREDVRLRRSHSGGGISSAAREGPDPSPTPWAEARAARGRCRGQDRCRGVINHQPGPDKRTFPAVLKEAKKPSVSRELQPPGASGTVSAVRGICPSRGPEPIPNLLARWGRPGCVCPPSPPRLPHPSTPRGDAPSHGPKRLAFRAGLWMQTFLRKYTVTSPSGAHMQYIIRVPERGLGSPVPNHDHSLLAM